MKDLTDFAVIARSASTGLIENLTGKNTVLRVVPLENAPTLSEALGGLLDKGVATFNANQNMTLEADGSISKSNIYSVQSRADGYVRVVAHINNEAVPVEVGDPIAPLPSALGFALLKQDGKGGWDVLAVASLQAGCDVTDGCYVAFTFSKTNNYQSVSFSPNAFATIEDLNNINGLDGLHIAFDHASGDIKLLDGKGNVLDQANLHMDADTIIADGEEGYKYVKTDIRQDIHAEKDFMPAGKTAQGSFSAEPYVPKYACFVVDVTGDPAVTNAQAALTNAGSDEVALALANAQLAKARMEAAKSLVEQGNIEGIRVYSSNSYVDYTLGGAYRNAVKGINNLPLLAVDSSNTLSGMEVYSPDAFVWTVGNVADLVKEGDKDASGNVGKIRVVDGNNTTYRDPTFAEQMNANAQALGFHIGDDIPLGTNISTLIATMTTGNADSPATGFDAEKFMHEGTDSDYIDELVDAQRNLAKEELVEWNKQHPALVHDGLSGTRISKDGLDVRNGKIEIGNGVANADNDSVKRYVIETDIDDDSAGARSDKGLQISVIASQTQSYDDGETVYSDVQKDILTINAEDYISGAPTCLALLKCHKDDNKGLTADLTETTGEQGSEVTVNVGRITANFLASGAEAGGVFTLTIVDNRANNDFGDVPRIVEIIPVYKSGADASEAVPAQRSISAIAGADINNKSTLSIHCSQVIDWAQSIALGGDVEPESGKPVDNGMELYLIVKVY